MRNRRGFSMIELFTVMLIIGLLARIGVPRYGDMRRQSRARAVVADFHAVRIAAMNYHGEKNSWPANSSIGVTPGGLATYLPTGFTFARGDVSLEWLVFNQSVWVGNTLVTTQTPAVSVFTTDAKLNAELVKLARSGYQHMLLGTRVAFLISGVS